MPLVRRRVCKVADTDQHLRGRRSESGYCGVPRASGTGTGGRRRSVRGREGRCMWGMKRRGGRGRGVLAFLVVSRVEERLQLCREPVLGLASGGGVAAAATDARFALRVGTREGGGGVCGGSLGNAPGQRW